MPNYLLRRSRMTFPEVGPNGQVHHAEMSETGISRCLLDCPACYGKPEPINEPSRQKR